MVLRRLEQLRTGAARPGWVPPLSPSAPAEAGDAAASAARPEHAVPGSRVAPRPPGLLARASQAWHARAFDPGRRGVAVLAGLALLGAAGGAWYFVTARPVPKSAAGSTAAATAPVGSAVTAGSAASGSPPEQLAAALSGWPSPSASASVAAPIVVDVVGKVVSPGVVELPAGARIRDAVEAAGGALPGTDLTALDLASRLSDGQEIFVGIPPPSGAAAQAGGGVIGGNPAGSDDGGSGSGGSGPATVDVNNATLAELETLPGVGPVLAQHILDWRTQHGRFAAVTQLQQVPGIGPSKYAALAAKVRV